MYLKQIYEVISHFEKNDDKLLSFSSTKKNTLILQAKSGTSSATDYYQTLQVE